MCITYSICAHTQQRAKCSSLESEEKKTDATTHFEFFFNQSSFRTKLAPPKHTSSDAKRRERRRLFSFFLLSSVHSSALLNGTDREEEAKNPQKELTFVCLNSKNDTVFTLYSYTPSLFIECLLLLYTSYLFNRERGRKRHASDAVLGVSRGW